MNRKTSCFSSFFFRCTLLLSLTLAIGTKAKAQPILKYTEFKSGEEMDHTRVACYAQDERGILWLGTWIGLCRYDGQNFQFFRSENTGEQPQSSNRIIDMEIDSDGHIWCVSNGLNLYRFNRHTSLYTPVFPLQNPENQVPTEEVRKGSRSIFCLRQNKATWVVLKDGSLLRFESNDPSKCETFPVEYEQKRNVYEIAEDEAGREWILTDRGVIIWGQKTMSDYPFNKITQIDKKIYLSSENGYFAEYTEDRLRFVNLPRTIHKINRTRALGNHLVALCTSTGLVLYNTLNDSLNIVNRTDTGEPIDLVTYANKDAHGNIWIYSDRTDDLYLLDPETLCARRIKSPCPGTQADKNHLVIEDASSTIWVKPYHSDLCWWDEHRQQLRPYTDLMPNGEKMPIASFNFYFFDHQKNLWISSGTNLFRVTFQPRQFLFSHEPEVSEVRALMMYDSTHILYGDKNRGMLCRTHLTAWDGTGNNVMPEKTQREYLSANGQWTSHPVDFARDGIYRLMRDSKGIVWVGTRGDGLYRLEPQNEGYAIQHFTHHDSASFSISNDDIYDIYEDEQNHIWIATFGGGLNLLDRRNGNIRFINSNNILPNYPTDDFRFVRTITGNGRGTLVAGTSSGLVNFTSVYKRPAEIVFHRQHHDSHRTDCLPNNVVMTALWVENAQDSAFYATTYGQGISRILNVNPLDEELSFHTYLNRDYPAGDVSFTSQVDRKGRIWTVSEPGISCYSPTENQIYYYDQTDFDRYYIFGEAQPLAMPNGEMIVGGKGGFMRFNTETLHKSDFTPEIVFTGIKYPGGDRNRILFNDLDTLKLTADHRSVNIQFAALDFQPSRLMRYAYKMDEADADWTYTTTPVVNYVNLPAGEFKLLVKSTNSDGVWCDNLRTLSIIVLPTFWETPWASLVYLLGILAIIVVIVLFYHYIYKLRQSVYIEKEMAAVKVNFFTDISHELRTPLTLIDGPISNVLAQEPLSKQAREHLELARKNASRMLELVNQILDFRKVQTRHVRLSLREENLLDLVTRCKKLFDDLALEKKIDYLINYDPSRLQEGAIYWLDADKVEKIVFNLLSNAFKYTDSGKAITIHVNVDQAKIHIDVTDQGHGIEASKLSTIFDRFVSLSDPKNMQPSSGIGLSLVKELVSLHHGEVSVESHVGVGSTFSVTLPAQREAYQDDPLVDFLVGKEDVPSHLKPLDEASPKSEMESASKPSRPTTILVVEDNAELRQFIVSILAPDYRVREAENGKEALSIVRNEEINFILTDVMMPVMDGMEMIRVIKSDPAICHVPIVVLSAKSSIDDRIEGLENGIDDYLTKPFSATYLKARVANLIHQRELLQQSFFAGMLSEPVSNDATAAKTEEGIDATIENNAENAPQLMEYDKAFVHTLMEYFEKNISNPDLSVGDLADSVNMSRTSFYRKLKAVLGLTPVDFIRQVRIRHAVKKINEGEDSLSQIAYSVGFSDPKYFSKCFKRDMGMPPAEYKLKVPKNV